MGGFPLVSRIVGVGLGPSGFPVDFDGVEEPRPDDDNPVGGLGAQHGPVDVQETGHVGEGSRYLLRIHVEFPYGVLHGKPENQLNVIFVDEETDF